MKTFKYPAIAFRQQSGAPIQVAFVAPAAEALEWSGIPRKSDELLTGYQRFRDRARIDREIVPFFQNPKNCSPTAAIIALRNSGGPGGCRLTVDEIQPGMPIQTELEIEVDETILGSDALFEAALRFVEPRILSDSNMEEAEPDPQDLDLADDDANDPESDASNSVHLGSATLNKMAELLRNKENWQNAQFRDAIVDYVKPAFLIDGQHRISAAARLGPKGLPFLFCGLFGADWQEQVFQFTVVNLKPKRIPPALITSIAGLSLTRSEQFDLQNRLSQAGIRMGEVAVMSLVAYDEHSPFTDLIDMAVGRREESAGRLGYGGMKRMAMVWYSGKRSSLTNIAKSAYETENAKQALEQWREDKLWFEFFVAMWNEIRASLPDALWKKFPSNRFMSVAHLWAFQEALFHSVDEQSPKYWKPSSEVDSFDRRVEFLKTQLLDLIKELLVYFPSEMWTVSWKVSQDTDAGRAALVELFRRFISHGKSHGRYKKWKDDEWFKPS